jgi:hypothetical protein
LAEHGPRVVEDALGLGGHSAKNARRLRSRAESIMARGPAPAEEIHH